MAFLDSFKRKKETDIKAGKDSSISTLSRNLEFTHSEQLSFHSVANMLKDGVQEGKPFKLAVTPISVSRAVRVPKRIPTTGESVMTRHNGIALHLKQALMTDHISVTYATNFSGFFAKIYTLDALQLDMLENKANRMLQAKIEIPGVCWPIDIITDNTDCFIGILVPASQGIQLTRSVFNGATGLSQFFSQWNKHDLCILSMTILDKIHSTLQVFSF